MTTIYREGADYNEVQAFRMLAFGKPVAVPSWPLWQLNAYEKLVAKGLAATKDGATFTITHTGRELAAREELARKDAKALVPVIPEQRKKPPFKERRNFPVYSAAMSTAEYVRQFCQLNQLKI